MMNRIVLILAVLLATPFFLILLVAAYAYATKFLSWRGLSADQMQTSADWYLHHRVEDVPTVTGICLYVLDCAGDRARLTAAPDLKQVDFEALKSSIWDRRFAPVCRGSTANLGLGVLRDPEPEVPSHYDLAIWSFFNNRFIPARPWGAFSEEPWQRCDREHATFVVKDGNLLTPNQP